MTTSKYSILLLFVSFVATSCKDDDTTSSISPSMEVLVDGER